MTAAWGFSCPSCDLRHLPCCIFRAVVQRRLAKDLISMWIWILSQIGQCSPYLGNVFGLVSQLYHQAVHCHVPLPWPLFCSRCCLAERKSGCTLSPGLSFAGSSDSLLGSLFPAGSSPYLVEKGAAGSWDPVVYLQMGFSGGSRLALVVSPWWGGTCRWSCKRGLWKVLVPLEQLLFVWKLPQVFLAQLHPWKSRITE